MTRLRIATKADLGWELPPGCREDDPNAPWNAKDIPEECPICGKENDGEWEDFCSDKCRREYREFCEY